MLPLNNSSSSEEAYLRISSVNSDYSFDYFQQPQQQEPEHENQYSSLKNLLQRAIDNLDNIQNQADSLRTLGDQVGELVMGIPTDTEIFEDVGKDYGEPVLVESEEVLEVSQTSSVLEGFVDESSEVFTVDSLVSE